MPRAWAVARRVLVFIGGGMLGLVTGYYAGALVGCHLLWPGKNLCGLLVIATVPLGVLGGVMVAARWAASEK